MLYSSGGIWNDHTESNGLLKTVLDRDCGHYLESSLDLDEQHLCKIFNNTTFLTVVLFVLQKLSFPT